MRAYAKATKYYLVHVSFNDKQVSSRGQAKTFVFGLRALLVVECSHPLLPAGAVLPSQASKRPMSKRNADPGIYPWRSTCDSEGVGKKRGKSRHSEHLRTRELRGNGIGEREGPCVITRPRSAANASVTSQAGVFSCVCAAHRCSLLRSKLGRVGKKAAWIGR